MRVVVFRKDKLVYVGRGVNEDANQEAKEVPPGTLRRSKRLRGLRGLGGWRRRSEQRPVEEHCSPDDMSNDRYSSSDVTESNDDGLAEGMMNLAIARRLVQRLPTRETSPVGNAPRVRVQLHDFGFMFRVLG